MNQVFPTQVGYTPIGSTQGSQVVIGGNPTGIWEAIGIGMNGRPDWMRNIVINLSDVRAGVNTTVPGVVNINANDLVSIIYADGSNAPPQLNLILREVAVCEVDDNGDSTEKRMVVLASETYPVPDGT